MLRALTLVGVLSLANGDTRTPRTALRVTAVHLICRARAARRPTVTEDLLVCHACAHTQAANPTTLRELPSEYPQAS